MIIWLDDDNEMSLAAWLEELREHYEVLWVREPNAFFAALEKNEERIDLIIMDIMLPTGGVVDANHAQEGRHTGAILLERVGENKKYSDIPVVIFTIRTDQDISDFAEAKKIPIYHKTVTLPGELVERISERIRGATGK